MYTILIIFITALIVFALIIAMAISSNKDYSGAVIFILYTIAFIAFYYLLTNYV